MTIFLGVNIDHVATLRQARLTNYPDPVLAMKLAEQGGADGITIHLREDRRHIQDKDVELIADQTQTRLNLEMAVSEEMLEIALRVKPTYVCLVPEKREELTTEGGLDVAGQIEKVQSVVNRLHQADIKVSLFIDPDHTQIDAALEVGAPYIELHTGCYADAPNDAVMRQELSRLIEAAHYADSHGLIVNAGHGLTIDNVAAIAAIPQIYELNIGHAIVARAIFIGLEAAVKEMKSIMLESRDDN